MAKKRPPRPEKKNEPKRDYNEKLKINLPFEEAMKILVQPKREEKK